jgi:anti-sigma-K factor RskA
VISLPDRGFHDDLGAFVLGTLAPEERERFESHLGACERCRADLHELAGAAALLPLTAPSAEPRAAVRARTLAAVERAASNGAPVVATPRRPRRRPFRLALPVAAATAAAALVAAVGLHRGGPIGALELEAALTAPAGGPAAATAQVRKTGIGRVIELRSDTLPILPRGEYYELWFVGPGDAPGSPNRISAGTFHPDERGRSDVTFAAAVDPAAFPVLVVTAEPGDGDPRPSGVEVLRSGR